VSRAFAPDTSFAGETATRDVEEPPVRRNLSRHTDGLAEQPEFVKASREDRRAGFGQSIAKLHQASCATVSTWCKVMVDTTTPLWTNVRGAEGHFVRPRVSSIRPEK
jgi:hypothetical protein